MHEVLNELRDDHAGRDVEIQLGELSTVTADRALLKQVFANLLSNAFKFTRNKERAVIEVGARMEDGEKVYFVRDNGAGFDMRYAKHLFGVFQRMHRREDFEGTGVGLSLAHRIVQRHGGRMWAEAEENRGAMFLFSLRVTGLCGLRGHLERPLGRFAPSLSVWIPPRANLHSRSCGTGWATGPSAAQHGSG